jgi:hypothetical protein
MAAVCLAVTVSLAQKLPVCLSRQRLLHSVRSLSLTLSICADMAVAECVNKLRFKSHWLRYVLLGLRLNNSTPCPQIARMSCVRLPCDYFPLQH